MQQKVSGKLYVGLTGINAAYVFGEFFTSDIDSFGSGMQVGADSWVLGLAFEY